MISVMPIKLSQYTTVPIRAIVAFLSIQVLPAIHTGVYLLASTCFFLCMAIPAQATQQANHSFVIGIQSDATTSSLNDFNNETRKFLETHLISTPFFIRELSGEEIINAAKKQEIDFFIADQTIFSILERFLNARALVSISKNKDSDVSMVSAGVVIVHMDSPFYHLSDLASEQFKVEIPSENFFPFLAVQRELLNLSLAPMHSFTKHEFENPSERDLRLAHEVANKVQNIAILPLCSYETLPTDIRKHLRVLSDEIKTFDSDLYQKSTPLYPGTVFASFSTNDHLNSLMSATLLAMPPVTDGSVWRTPAHYDSVQELLAAVDAPAWRDFVRVDWLSFVSEHKTWFFAIIATLLAWIVHTIRTEALVRRRTEALLRTMDEKSQAEEREKRSLERIAALERTGIVGEISTILAHDLKNPLAIIHNYARGIKRLIQSKSDISPDELEQIIQSIDEQSVKASAMIDHVRSYAKLRRRETSIIDYSSLVREEVRHFIERSNINVKQSIVSGIFIESSEIELRVVLTNLLRNAKEASTNQPIEPFISVELYESDRRAILVIEDNGPRLSDEDFERLSTPLRSSKPEGLGLGLVIVRRTVEADCGHLEFERKPVCGLRSILRFPIVSPDSLESQHDS